MLGPYRTQFILRPNFQTQLEFGPRLTRVILLEIRIETKIIFKKFLVEKKIGAMLVEQVFPFFFF